MRLLVVIIIALVGGLGLTKLEAQSIRFAHLAGKQPVSAEAYTSSCVLIDGQGTLVTIAELGADVNRASLTINGSKVPLKFVVADRDSRLVIYRIPAESMNLLPPQAQLGSSRGLIPSTAVYTSATKQAKPARIVSKVHWFQGDVLPLAVLRVNHSQAPPAAGSGLYDADGKLVGLIRQTTHNNKTSSYCLPVEVITRTLKDFRLNKQVNRCWIGIIMDQLVAAPIIEGVRPASPANKAGLLKGDIILSVGAQNVTDCAEVVDAFYYLVAGASEKIRIIRGTKVMELDVMPEVVPGS